MSKPSKITFDPALCPDLGANPSLAELDEWAWTQDDHNWVESSQILDTGGAVIAQIVDGEWRRPGAKLHDARIRIGNDRDSHSDDSACGCSQPCEYESMESLCAWWPQTDPPDSATVEAVRSDTTPAALEDWANTKTVVATALEFDVDFNAVGDCMESEAFTLTPGLWKLTAREIRSGKSRVVGTQDVRVITH